MNSQQKAEVIRKSLDELAEIQRRPLQHAVVDLNVWLETKLELTRALTDELVTELDPEYPDQQRIYNAEFENLTEVLV